MGDIPMMDAYREHTEPLPSSAKIWLPGMVLLAVFAMWAGFVLAAVRMQ